MKRLSLILFAIGALIGQPPQALGDNLSEALVSKAWLLIELPSGKVVTEHNSQSAAFPASLAKLMAARVILERGYKPETPVTVKAELFAPLWRANAYLSGFEAGEIVRSEDLLAAMLLASGAEAAEALCDSILPRSEFVAAMNEEAQNMGLNDSHFTNVTGLHQPEQHSTPADLAKLLQALIKDRRFVDIFTQKHWTTKPTNLHPNGLSFRSTVLVYNNDQEILFPGGRLLGAKTGSTSIAGLNLASWFELKGRQYLFITCGAPYEPDSPGHLLDLQQTVHWLTKGE